MSDATRIAAEIIGACLAPPVTYFDKIEYEAVRTAFKGYRQIRIFVNREEKGADSYPTVYEILCGVSRKHGVTVDDILSKRRGQRIVDARFEVYFEAQRQTLASLPQIAAVLKRDHSTVLHGIRRHQARIDAGEA